MMAGPARSVTKPGPPSFQDLVGRIDHALRNLGDRIELNRNPLTRLACVEERAKAHAARVHPRAIALRELVERAAYQVVTEIEQEPRLQHVRKFLVLYRDGTNVTDAAKALGISREHRCRITKRRAVELVAEKFLQLAATRGRGTERHPEQMIVSLRSLARTTD